MTSSLKTMDSNAQVTMGHNGGRTTGRTVLMCEEANARKHDERLKTFRRLLCRKWTAGEQCTGCGNVSDVISSGLQVSSAQDAAVSMTSSEHDADKRAKRDAGDALLSDEVEAEKEKRLPRLGLRALPRLGLRSSADKRLPRLGYRQRRLPRLGLRGTSLAAFNKRLPRLGKRLPRLGRDADEENQRDGVELMEKPAGQCRVDGKDV